MRKSFLWASIRIPVRIGAACLFPTTRCSGICSTGPGCWMKLKVTSRVMKRSDTFTIRTQRPKVVCFIGKITLNTFQGSRACDYGWQENIGNAKVYLMHFPIRGPASIRVRELREVKRASRFTRPMVDRREDPQIVVPPKSSSQ